MSSGIVKVITSFFRQGSDNAFERHRSRVHVDVEKQGTIQQLKKHLIDFLGIRELSQSYGLGSFELKLFRMTKISGKTENYAIITQRQLELELPCLLSETDCSELNGKSIFTFTF